jgi:MFS transporter, CP family, cyanate transporter
MSAARLLREPAFVVVLAGVGAALHVGKLPPALPVLREALGVSLVEAGFLLSLVQLAGMTLGLFVGLAADALGLRRSMIAGLVLLAVCSAVGMAARAPADLLVLRGLEGFGFLLVSLPAPSLIRQLVSPERLARSLGWWGAYMPLGTALALLAGPVWLGAIGWQGWWGLLGGLALAMALWVSVVVPSDARRRGPQDVGGDPLANRLRRAGRTLAATLRSAGPWLVAACFAMYSGQWLAVVGFLPSIYAQAGLSGAVLGVLTAVAAGVNMLGNIGSGRLLARGLAPATLLGCGYGAMLVGAFLAFAAPQALPPALRYAGVLLFSAVGGLVPGTLFSLAVRLAPGEHAVSTTVGWMQQWSALGQFAGPPLVAWLASRAGGWQWTWVATGLCALTGAAFAAIIHRVLRTHSSSD